jgi:hypothetical protein
MDEEQIIRNEATEFFNWNIDGSHNRNAIDDFHELKSRLNDFYNPENKSIFLDQIEILIKTELQKHRVKYHGGNPDPTCQIEIKAENLLFYIKQEINTLPIIAHQRFQTQDKLKRTKVFISYSHLDNDALIDVQRHFKPFLKKIDYWDDSKISPGQKWKDEIRSAIDKTKVVILLVSTDFLGSDFIATNELPPLLNAAENEGAVILIVILKPCLFEEFPDLNQFQAMNPPNKPVSKMSCDEKEELFVNLVRQTKRILDGK